MMLNNNIKYCREELEMTQDELGYVFGVSRKTVAGWDNNHDTIPLPKLVKFSNLYKAYYTIITSHPLLSFTHTLYQISFNMSICILIIKTMHYFCAFYQIINKTADKSVGCIFTKV